MPPQNWMDLSASDSSAVAPPPRVLRYDLRPLAVGEILDRIFSMYRANFWLLAGLSAVSAGVSVGISMVRVTYLHFAAIGIRSPSYTLVIAAFSIAQVVLYLIAYSLTLASTTSAVNALYLGETTSMGRALRTARRLWLRCLGVSIWQTWSGIWIMMALIIPFSLSFAIPGIRGAGVAVLGVFLVLAMIAAGIYGVIAYLRNSLAIPAAVIEDLGVRAAMRRSKRLATGRIGRIFLLILLVYALTMTAAVIQIPLAFVLLRAHATEQFVLQGLVLAINFVVTTVVGPIAAIGLCLFYFDERVRREGFDIDFLLHSASLGLPAVEPLPIASVFAATPSDPPQPASEQI